MTVVLTVLLDTNDVVTEAWDAIDVSSRSSKEAFESFARNRDSEFVCWYYEKQKTSEHRKMQRILDMWQSKDPRVVDNKGRSKRELKYWPKCRKASVFEASNRDLTETRYVDMTNVDLNALEVGSVLILHLPMCLSEQRLLFVAPVRPSLCPSCLPSETRRYLIGSSTRPITPPFHRSTEDVPYVAARQSSVDVSVKSSSIPLTRFVWMYHGRWERYDPRHMTQNLDRVRNEWRSQEEYDEYVRRSALSICIDLYKFKIIPLMQSNSSFISNGRRADRSRKDIEWNSNGIQTAIRKYMKSNSAQIEVNSKIWIELHLIFISKISNYVNHYLHPCLQSNVLTTSGSGAKWMRVLLQYQISNPTWHKS